MIILKQVIHYPDTNSVEATWVDRTEKTEYYTGEDGEGCVLEPGDEVQVKCHSYADVQMDMLRADLGDAVAEYEELIALVISGINPVEPAPIIHLVPISVTPWQIRKALNELNLRQMVEDAVKASMDIKIKDGWEFATEFRRNDELVITLGYALDKTDLELDALFELAASL